jgi:hypothetical protein
MNEQDNQERDNQQSMIEDLTVNEDAAAEVKGGPIAIIIRTPHTRSTYERNQALFTTAIHDRKLTGGGVTAICP